MVDAPPLDTTWALGFLDDRLGFAGGIAPFQGAHIYRTVDGGRTWTQHQLSATYVGYPYSVAVPDARSCYVMTSATDVSNVVFRSLDGGDTWSSVSQGIGGL